MKNVLGLLVLSFTLGGVFFPNAAHAETSFSFSMSDGDYPHHYSREPFYGPRHHRQSYRPHYYRPHSSLIYVQPSPTVIYETPVIQVPPQYVTESALVADPASASYVNETGQLCREYQSMALVNGQQSQIYGTACLQPDGAWRVVD
ncbi:MAG: hypothetical protein PHD48_00415 [Alphaproteobacteria bacterium]|nr:hypothetical protein [Alphaproteobacteria bacterium]